MNDTRIYGHLFLDYALRIEPGLARELVEDPISVLERLGLDVGALQCTEEAHAALEKGEDFARRLNGLDGSDLRQALPEMAVLARDVLGDDFVVTKLPFGLRFAERVGVVGKELTGTVSGECTFGLECRADVDG